MEGKQGKEQGREEEKEKETNGRKTKLEPIPLILRTGGRQYLT
jgi:hypothetical protein